MERIEEPRVLLGRPRPGPKRTNVGVLCVAFALLGPGPLPGQERGTTRVVEALRARIGSEGAAATRPFWDDVARKGTPLVEAGEDGRLRITLLWRGGADLGPVAVFSAATGWTQPGHLLEWMPGTDVWHGTFVVPSDARFTYRVSLHDNLRTYYRDPDWRDRSANLMADPLNPDTVELGGGVVASLFEGPDADMSDLLEVPRDAPRGRLMEMAVSSGVLGEERSLLIYVPPGGDPPPVSGLPLLILLDGDRYTTSVPTPAILDNLIAQDRIPPVVAAFVKQADRSRELSANVDFTRFLADELVPQMRRRFRAGLDPSVTTIGGSSLGGLAAAYAALTRPEVFGAVLAQSGSFWWAPQNSPEPGWLMRSYAARPRSSSRFYLEVGRLEREPVRGGPTMLDLTRHMRDVLCAKGYPVWYRETGGDHAYATWRHTLAAGLESILLPSGRSSSDQVLPGCVDGGR